MERGTHSSRAEAPPVIGSRPKVRRFRILGMLRKMRRLVPLLWPHARPHKGLLLVGGALSASVIVFRVAQPWPLKWVIDGLSGSPSHHRLFPWMTEHPEIDFAALAGLYVLLSLLAGLAEYGQLLTLAGLGNRVLFSFRTALFTHVLRQPLAFHEGRDMGELLTRVVYDTSRLRRGVNGILTRIFLTVFTFFAILAILFWLDVRLALVVCVTGLLTLAAMGRTGQRIFRAARKQRKREGRLAAVVAENLMAIREFHTFRPGTASDERFVRQNAKSLKQEQKVRRLRAQLLVRVDLLLAIAITLILWLGARAVQAGRLTPGDLVLFVSYAVGLYRPFVQFARQTAQSGKTFASAERLSKIMRREPAVADLPGAILAPPLRGEILFEEASVKSPRRRRTRRKWALSEVTLHVQAGERVGVIGPNGAGKSTLLRLLLRLVEPDRGRVLVDGRNLNEYTLESLRGQVSIVFQDSLFFGLTVRENIALGQTQVRLEEVQAAARRSRAADLIECLPHGYDTVVRHQGKLFSVGERQRIALARALLRDGRIWLLDEPTTGLDTETAEDLIKLLLQVTRGRTVLWVTHDLRILPALDRVAILDEGRIRFWGTPEENRRWLPEDMTVAEAPKEA